MTRLTPAEHLALLHAAYGYSARESAESRLVSRETIARHRQRVIAKLEARNMVHAVLIATREGVIS